MWLGLLKKKYIVIKLLMNRDMTGKHNCICNYNNPNCINGYKDKCKMIECLIPNENSSK